VSPCVKVKSGLAMPLFFRWLFLFDLHKMFKHFETGVQAGDKMKPRIAVFKVRRCGLKPAKPRV
jgi:hypothetical protein